MRSFHPLELVGALVVFSLSSLYLGQKCDDYFVAREAEGVEGAAVTTRRMSKSYELSRPELVVLGNSILEAGVNRKQLRNTVGLRTFLAPVRGSASALWYAYLKYEVLAKEQKPKYVVILFRDILLTFPTYRTEWRYQGMIRALAGDDPLMKELVFSSSSDPITQLLDDNWPLYRSRDQVREVVELTAREKLLENLPGVERADVVRAVGRTFSPKNFDQELATLEEEDAGISKDFLPYFDFDAHVEDSFLPAMIDLCQEAGVELILVRAPARRDLPELLAQKELPRYARELLPDYLAKLTAYLEQREVTFIDFHGEPELRDAHFGIGDHMNLEIGQPLFTGLLGERLLEVGVGMRDRWSDPDKADQE
jgi:hypothetical protein